MRYTQTRDVQKLYDYLTTYGPEPRTVPCWAYYAGLTPRRVYELLSLVRSRGFIEHRGWTIPHVGQGGGMKNPYSVVAGSDAQVYLDDGVNIEVGDVVSKMKVLDAQLDFATALKTAHPLIPVFRHNVKSMLAMADALGI